MILGQVAGAFNAGVRAWLYVEILTHLGITVAPQLAWTYEMRDGARFNGGGASPGLFRFLRIRQR